MSNVVHFQSKRHLTDTFISHLELSLRTHGDQGAMTRIASMMASIITFLVRHYGLEQAEAIFAKAAETGFAIAHNRQEPKDDRLENPTDGR